jgi:hypothetical protein
MQVLMRLTMPEVGKDSNYGVAYACMLPILAPLFFIYVLVSPQK